MLSGGIGWVPVVQKILEEHAKNECFSRVRPNLYNMLNSIANIIDGDYNKYIF